MRCLHSGALDKNRFPNNWLREFAPSSDCPVLKYGVRSIVLVNVPDHTAALLLSSKAMVVNVAENAGTRFRQARLREASASELLMTCRKR
jgi:hypothetical protein